MIDAQKVLSRSLISWVFLSPRLPTILTGPHPSRLTNSGREIKNVTTLLEKQCLPRSCVSEEPRKAGYNPPDGVSRGDSVSLNTAVLRNLVDRVRQGDPDAEAEVVRQFTSRIFVMSFVRTRDREIARELVQDVLMSVIGSLRKGQLQDPDKLLAFLHGTARNLINNRLRSEYRRPPLEPLSDEIPEESRIEQLEDAERLGLVHRALESLANEDRDILRMTLVEGRKPGEIARLLGVTSEVVRTRKLRAARKVAEFVQNTLSRSRANSPLGTRELK